MVYWKQKAVVNQETYSESIRKSPGGELEGGGKSLQSGVMEPKNVPESREGQEPKQSIKECNNVPNNWYAGVPV